MLVCYVVLNFGVLMVFMVFLLYCCVDECVDGDY